MTATKTTPRLQPLEPPYPDDVGETLKRMVPPGLDPIILFRTLAHHPVLLDKLRTTGAYLLNHGAIDPIDREILIDRTTANRGSEYEWGVHVALFANAVGLTEEQVASTVLGGPDDACWNDRQALLIRLCDEICETNSVSDGLWAQLSEHYTPLQLIECVTLVGQYTYISYLTNALRLDLEDYGARFPTA